jgi:hypothetical protein
MKRKGELVRRKRGVSSSSIPLRFISRADVLSLQGARSLRSAGTGCGRTTRGCLRRIPPLIKIPHPRLNIKGRRRGSSRGIYPRNGSPSRPHPCCGSTENVRPSVPCLLLDIDASNNYSRFREERPLVCCDLSCSLPRNLHR